jgi:hypothetical protein
MLPDAISNAVQVCDATKVKYLFQSWVHNKKDFTEKADNEKNDLYIIFCFYSNKCFCAGA